MLTIISPFKRTFGVLMAALGIFWLPKDVQDYEQAVQPWQEMAAMVDQNTALWAFVAVLVAVIAWSDGRAFVAKRRLKNAREEFDAWKASRTRFTIREAACVFLGVHPRDYEQSLDAQSQANEILYYVRRGLIPHAALSPRQFDQLKNTGRADGYDPDAVTLDTYLTRREVEKYLQPGWRVWLPILDNQWREIHN